MSPLPIVWTHTHSRRGIHRRLGLTLIIVAAIVHGSLLLAIIANLTWLWTDVD